ncbi:GNAT family N-acetyltransferase [Streptomyces sp. NPDC059740]|uniref:bifunctional acetate--CoA ligase family protein/GNAT family N-acetyltransferase n=1 Tax=Streptomyces sp. NPDC059740 TaxID=3346926 RepID=UPI00365D6DCD
MVTAADSDPEHPAAYPAHWEADVVLRDGGTARVRPITPDDAERLVAFYEQVSDESKYYRFFAPYPRLSDRDVHRFTHHDYVDRVGLAATVGGEFIATVRYDRIDDTGRPATADTADQAEVAFLVRDDHQGRGVASTLLEHVAAVALERGVRRFAAEVLPANTKMIKVFTDAGYTQKRSFEDGVVRLELDLEPTERSLAVMRGREQRAEARAVQRLLAPESVAVVGVGRRPGGVGRTVVRNLLDAGFTGRVHAVNHAFPADPGTPGPEGVPGYRSVREIPEPVDLAVVSVPADAVPDVVRDCGAHGVRSLVVLSSGYAETGPAGRDRQRELLRLTRSHGMRLIGPNAFGVLNTAAGVRLNASLAPLLPAAGRIGLFTQSGAIGIALLSALHRRGPAGAAAWEPPRPAAGEDQTPAAGPDGRTPARDAAARPKPGEGAGETASTDPAHRLAPGGLAGLSTFVSAGNRADVSGNDLLQYWYDDPTTDVVLLYLESIGNPRKFTRLARRTAAVKPVVVAKGARHHGMTPPGHAVPTSHIPDATVTALMRQAGVIRVDTVTELIDVGLLLAAGPLPAGPRVAIIGNSEALAFLTYDSCLTEGLRPLQPHVLAASASPEDFHQALRRTLADENCDAVVVTAIPWVGEGQFSPHDPASTAPWGEGADLAAALRTAAGGPKPVAVAHLAMDALATCLATRDEGHPVTIPAYPAAERAVRALAEATWYARWRRQAAVPGRVPEFEDIEEAAAGEDITRLLADLVDEADPHRSIPLPPATSRALLARYGIDVRPAPAAADADAAVAAAQRLGYPVALKTTAPHLRHRADLGGVRLDLRGEDELRRAYADMTAALGTPRELRPVVQAMVPRGVDTVLRAAVDPVAGAVLTFGLAGAPSQLLGDTAHRLIPATDRDVAEQVRSVRAAPLLFGWRGAEPVDTTALEELMLRLSRLVDDHPEVVGVDLEPVVVAPRGVAVLDAAVRLARPPATTDLGPRRLPAY